MDLSTEPETRMFSLYLDQSQVSTSIPPCAGITSAAPASLTSHRRRVPSPEAEAKRVADVGDQIVEYTQ